MMEYLQLDHSLKSLSALCCSVAVFHPHFLFLSLVLPGCFDLFNWLIFLLLPSLYSIQMIIFVHYRKMESCHSTYAFNSILRNIFELSLRPYLILCYLCSLDVSPALCEFFS